jgi:selenocysteine lyase/cysteine desulfurase
VIPVIGRPGRTFVRISCQAYNTQEDMDTLFMALEETLPVVATVPA